MDAGPLRREDEAGGVSVLTLADAATRNSLSEAMLAALADAFAVIETDRAVRCVVLAAEGSVFSSGHHLGEMQAHRNDPDGGRTYVEGLFARCAVVMTSIARLRAPVIAAVEGLATAAGCQLVATCDLAVAARSAGFAAPGGKGGWFCHTPMVAIARDIGRKHAAELAYTGDVITADKALEWGLVNQVVPDADLDTAVADLLARATRGSRSSKALGKLTLHQQLAMSQDAAYQLAVQVMADSSQTAAAQEGMTAFLEKRSPRWPD